MKLLVIHTQSHRALLLLLFPAGCFVVSCHGAICDASVDSTGQRQAGRLFHAPTQTRHNGNDGKLESTDKTQWKVF